MPHAKAPRQGDVLLVPLAAGQQPTGQPIKQIKGRYILAEGEQTGHHHSVPANAGTAFLTNGVKSFLRVTQPVKLAHQEHTALPIDPGDYEVVLQRHATPDSEHKVLRVID